MTLPTNSSDAANLRESIDRLDSWTRDISIGRFETPVYRNPGELKRDVRVVLSALDLLSDDAMDQVATDLANGVTYGKP